VRWQSFSPDACVKMNSVLAKAKFVGGLEAVNPENAANYSTSCQARTICTFRKSRIWSGFQRSPEF
jgi:hypothetical protein